MDNLNPTPPNLPPPYSQPSPAAIAPPPLGDMSEDRIPIPNTFGAIESILRQPRRVMFQLRQPGAGKLLGSMLLIAILCSLIYGVVVGSFSMGVQLWAAPAKIAGGLLFTTVICLPSLYIFACLSGSRARLIEIVGLVCGMMMLMTILLIGFAPIAWLFSQSTESRNWMGTLHLLFWGIATIFGLRFLQSGFAQSQARSKAGLNTWIVIFMLVALQMTTALRPIVGTADTLLPVEKKFFLSHWIDCVEQTARSSRY